jgi:hypothetical protein
MPPAAAPKSLLSHRYLATAATAAGATSACLRCGGSGCQPSTDSITKRPNWSNRTAKLVDPLYMLSRQPGTLDGHMVEIAPFRKGKDYADYSGFTYILPCTSKK